MAALPPLLIQTKFLGPYVLLTRTEMDSTMSFVDISS